MLVALGVGAVALLMFLSPHDALIMALLLAFAGGLTAYSAQVLAAGVLDDIESVRDGVRAVGDGRRDVEIHTDADDEIARAGGGRQPDGRPAGGARGRTRRRGDAPGAT